MEKTIDEALEYLTDFDLYSPYQEAIDKVSAYIEQMQSDYEARLKADMVAMLEELSLEIDEMDCTIDHDFEGYYTGHVDCQKLIREKINALRGTDNADKSSL